jgi:ArsR family transcriptional regulator, arsenate/arsenite/antimonite-responsive transcriptional repressor
MAAISLAAQTASTLSNCHRPVIYIGKPRYMEDEELLRALRALAQPTRLRTVALLARTQTGMAAGAIAEKLGVPQNTLSGHLAQLIRAGLLDGERRGRHIIFELDKPVLSKVARSFAAIAR